MSTGHFVPVHTVTHAFICTRPSEESTSQCWPSGLMFSSSSLYLLLPRTQSRTIGELPTGNLGASRRENSTVRESQTITVRNCSPDSGLIKSWSLEKQSPDKGRSARQVQTKIKNKRVRNVSVLWWLTCPHLSFNTCGGGLHGSLFVS